MHINVGCVLAELLAQTGYENGPLDCCVPTAAATRPAAAWLTVNLKTLHKARVKEISERVAHSLNAFLTFFFVLAQPSEIYTMAAHASFFKCPPLCCFSKAEFLKRCFAIINLK